MKSILTPEQMQKADAAAIRLLRIPGFQLMERAGEAVALAVMAVVRTRRKHGGSVLVLCGKGNNGGDGFVAARVLLSAGISVTVVMLRPERELRGDAAVNFNALVLMRHSGLTILPVARFLRESGPRYDAVVDAIFGTSFHGPVTGTAKSLIAAANRISAAKIAVDLPSGLDGETGEAAGTVFRADVTIALSNPKLGFYRDAARDVTGAVVVAEIGIPESVQPRSQRFLVEATDVRNTFPHRPSNSHKHSVGKVFVLAGAQSMTGAALLSSMAVMRSGAGQTILGVPDSEYWTIARRTLEVMPLPLPSEHGALSLDALTLVRERLRWADVVLIGPGLGRQQGTQELILRTIAAFRGPMVIDADALWALAHDLSVLKKKHHRGLVLTPHHGEFARLSGMTTDAIQSDPFTAAARFATKFGVTLVLKGGPTVIAIPDGHTFVNPTGNPGMSTAGSGDVLAGIIASLLAQGNDAGTAAVNGVFLHGLAGDRAQQRFGMHGLLARDILTAIPKSITHILSGP